MILTTMLHTMATPTTTVLTMEMITVTTTTLLTVIPTTTIDTVIITLEILTAESAILTMEILTEVTAISMPIKPPSVIVLTGTQVLPKTTVHGTSLTTFRSRLSRRPS